MISVEEKFNAVLEALKSKGNFDLFTERSKTLTGIEAKLNCALAVLKESADIVESINESGRWDLTFKVNQPIKETVRKNNGAEMVTIFESGERDALEGQGSTSYSYQSIDEAGDADAYQLETARIMKGSSALESKNGFITESNREEAANMFAGIPSKWNMPEGLSEGQREEYKFARSIGISESDALRLVKLTGGYNGRSAYGAL